MEIIIFQYVCQCTENTSYYIVTHIYFMYLVGILSMLSDWRFSNILCFLKQMITNVNPIWEYNNPRSNILCVNRTLHSIFDFFLDKYVQLCKICNARILIVIIITSSCIIIVSKYHSCPSSNKIYTLHLHYVMCYLYIIYTRVLDTP